MWADDNATSEIYYWNPTLYEVNGQEPTIQELLDIQAPTAPTLSSTGNTDTTIDLSWTGATDNIGITGYKVFKDATLEATLGNVSTYQVTGLAANTSYNFSVTALDAAGNESVASNTVSITTNVQSGGGTTVSSQIASSAQDAEENVLTGAISLTSPDLDFLFDGPDDHENQVGLHFTGLNIPAGATIQSAHIQFTADEAHSGTMSMLIYGEAADNPQIWSTASSDITGRTKTTASIIWSPLDWTVLQERGAAQQTSNLSTIIQEIVDRIGYASTDAINIIMVKNSEVKRVAETYDGSPNDAPELFVTYTTGGGSGGSGSTVWTQTSNDITYNTGNVGIGLSNPDEKLTVKGTIHAQEVKVDLNGVLAPDYVFLEDYQLRSLEEVRNYIKEHGHLPNIPSAKEMETQGVKLKKLNMKLLEKIEELTLYTLEQQQTIEYLIKELEILKNKK